MSDKESLHILFVCTYRGARSRMAEIFAREVFGPEVLINSACFQEGVIGGAPLRVMAELGLTMPTQSPTSVFTRFLAKERYDYVVALCDDFSERDCPVFKRSIDTLYGAESRRINWKIGDFASLEGAQDAIDNKAREIRDQVRTEVGNLAGSLNSANDS